MRKQTRPGNLSKRIAVLLILLAIVAVGVRILGLLAHAETLPQVSQSQGQVFEAKFLYGDPEPGYPGYDPSYVKASPDSVQNEVAVGDMILPTISIHPSNLGTPKPVGQFAVVTTFHYPSSFVRLNSVHCDSSTRCIVVAWPSFGGPTGGFGSQHDYTLTYTDRTLSVCTDRPNRDPNTPFGQGDDMDLFSPKFIVINNSDAFPIYATSRVYNDASCVVNGGQSATYRNQNTDGNCMNRVANGKPGNDGNGYPLQCGLGVQGGGNPGNDMPGVEGGLGTPGNSPVNPGLGNSPSPNPGRGGGGGSSATTQSDSNSSLPESSDQGDNEQPKLEPSPFFDGKLFAAGSDASAIDTVTVGGLKLGYGWFYLGGAVLLLGVAGFLGWKYRQKLEPTLASTLRALHIKQ